MQHLALVMDGNRRWAKKQGLASLLGHKKGVETVQKVIEFCLSKKIPYVSLYTFSLENFHRSPEEIAYLFDLMVQEAHNHIETFIKQSICIRFIGDRSQFPERLKETIVSLENATQAGTALTVNLLFCYGSRQEIVCAVKDIQHAISQGKLQLEEVTEQTLSSYLWTGTMPEPELIIRTGGVKRLSNFLLYQGAYAELCFLDCLWPELELSHLEQALLDYSHVKRNFGR